MITNYDLYKLVQFFKKQDSRLCHLIFLLWREYHLAYFTDEESEAQKDYMSGLRLHSL